MEAGMMGCPLGLGKMHRSSCYFYLGECHCDSLPGPLVQVLAGKGRLLAWPGYGLVKNLDDIALEVLERALTAGFREGIGSIQGTLLRSVVLEKLRRLPGQTAN